MLLGLESLTRHNNKNRIWHTVIERNTSPIQTELTSIQFDYLAWKHSMFQFWLTLNYFQDCYKINSFIKWVNLNWHVTQLYLLLPRKNKKRQKKIRTFHYFQVEINLDNNWSHGNKLCSFIFVFILSLTIFARSTT